MGVALKFNEHVAEKGRGDNIERGGGRNKGSRVGDSPQCCQWRYESFRCPVIEVKKIKRSS